MVPYEFGVSAFFALLAEVTLSKVALTEEFLMLAMQHFGAECAAWGRQRLKE